MPPTALNIPTSTAICNPSRKNSGNTKRGRPRLTPRYRSACRRIGGLTELQHHRLQRYRAKLRSMPNGQCDWSMSRWGTFFKVSKKQFQRDSLAWVEHGHIVRIPRTGKDYPCDTYLWMLPSLPVVGGVDINDQNLPNINTNTNTTTPREEPRVVVAPPPPKPKVPSKAQQEYEARQEWDRECTRRMLDDRAKRRDHDHECRQRVLGIYEENACRWRWHGERRQQCRVSGRPDPLVGAGQRPDGFYSGQATETEAEKAYREEFAKRGRRDLER